MNNENLKEAIGEYIESKELVLMAYPPEYIEDVKKDMEIAFRAGAEYMASQGVNAVSDVCKLADRAWVNPIDEKKFMQDVFDNFAAGDKVVVQIRKK